MSVDRCARGRFRPTLLLGAAAVLAVACAAVPAFGGFGTRPHQAANYWKWEGDAAHYRGGGHGKDASAKADARQNARCRVTAYRRANLAHCPANGSRFQPVLKPGQRRANDGVSSGEWDFGPANPVRPSPFLVPDYAINQILLPTGKILLISKLTDSPTPPEQRPDGGSGTAHLFDPATGQYTAVDPPNVPGQEPGDTALPNLFCVGHAQLADGRILVAGGQRASSAAGHGIQGHRGLWIFNPFTETWQVQGLMHHGRWYPTLTTLADGRVVIMSGFDEYGREARAADATHPAVEGERINREIEVFTPNPNPDLPGTLERVSAALPADLYSEGPSHAMDLYPRNVLLPDGRILMAGPSTVPSVLTPRPTGAGDWTWQDLPEKAVFPGSQYEYGNWTTAVLRPFELNAQGVAPATQVQLMGGTAGPSNHGTTHTYVLKTANVSAGFAKVPAANSIQIPRAHHNTVQLPDGSMVTIGGGLGTVDPADTPEIPGGNHLYDGAIFSTEIYNPTTNSWAMGPSNAQRRTYHSTALLLPDGRVLSAGDDRETKRSHPSQWVAEYYKPAYLFRGARPTIAGATGAAGYGSAITISTPDAESIRSAVLIPPAAVTHGVDMQGRMIIMPATVADAGHVTVTTPVSGNVAPPGYYMLFLVNTQGVPSKAQWVRIDPNAPTNVPPVASFDATTSTPTVGQRVTFSSTSADADGSLTTQDWDLDGDGVFNDAAGASASTIFKTPGTVTVGLRVTDNLGAVAITTKTITVAAATGVQLAGNPAAGTNIPPTAAFTVTTTSPRVGGRPMKFVDTSTDSDGQIVSRAWDLQGDFRYDDGGKPSLNRTFKTVGRHVVRLRVTDNQGSIGETEILLLVRKRLGAIAVGCAFTVRRHGTVTKRPGIVRAGTCIQVRSR